MGGQCEAVTRRTNVLLAEALIGRLNPLLPRDFYFHWSDRGHILVFPKRIEKGRGSGLRGGVFVDVLSHGSVDAALEATLWELEKQITWATGSAWPIEASRRTRPWVKREADELRLGFRSGFRRKRGIELQPIALSDLDAW
jgi:hypothetical protein